MPLVPRPAPLPASVPAATHYWSVPKEWTGEVCFVLAGGVSLRSLKSIEGVIRLLEAADCAHTLRYKGLLKIREQLLVSGDPPCPFDPESLRRRGRIIVVNDSYLLCPWADVLHFCDRQWWAVQKEIVRKVFGGKYITSMGTAEDGIHRLRHGGLRGLNPAADSVAHGGNSGFQAINLAHNFGCSKIYLLGFDMHCRGGTHWHSGHGAYDANVKVFEGKLQQGMLPQFQSLVGPLKAAGVEVVNCNPASAMKCWPIRPLEEVLAEMDGTAAESSALAPTAVISSD